MNKVKREPVGIVTAVVTTIEAGILMMIGLGYLNWTPEQTSTVMVFVAAISGIATWAIARYFVTPVSDPRDWEGNQLVPKNTSE